ncbi:MAG: hypothetical protein ABI321_13590 [Polyangia bacterium]
MLHPNRMAKGELYRQSAMPVKGALRAELEVVHTEILEGDEHSDDESKKER